MTTLGKVAYDFDGVLCEKPMPYITKAPNLLAFFYKTAAVNSWFPTNKQDTLIITARLDKDINKLNTFKWLNDNNYQNYKVFFYSKEWGQKSLKTIGNYKASVILQNKVEIYFDDNLDLLKIIKKKCPLVKLYFVNNATQTLILI